MRGSIFRRMGIALMVMPLLVLGLHYLDDLMEIQECLGAGGLFDYATGSCGFTAPTDYVPYSVRYRWNLNIALGVSLIGLVLAALGGRARRAGRLGSYS